MALARSAGRATARIPLPPPTASVPLCVQVRMMRMAISPRLAIRRREIMSGAAFRSPHRLALVEEGTQALLPLVARAHACNELRSVPAKFVVCEVHPFAD